MIYLDNAATTFPKPTCLSREISNCIQQYCGNPGRSGHILSLKAGEKIYECRETIASFFGSSNPENVVFTFNTTYAINIALKSLFQKGSHILISNMEHNSVYRPVHRLFKDNEAEYSFFNILQSTPQIIEELERKIRYNTTMLIMTHSSNICGAVFPIKEIGDFCKKHNVTFIVDAAQSAGNIDINIKNCNISALCVPGHKGLYGPQGIGFVLFGTNPTFTVFEGGTGENSLSEHTGTTLPESYEVGTVSTPLIAGLDASIKWVKSIGIKNINEHERSLALRLADMLKGLNEFVVYDTPQNNGIVLFSGKTVSTEQIYYLLNRHNVCARNGLHCAPLAHRALGTPTDGAIRFSAGWFNSVKEFDSVYKVLKNI